MGYESEQRPHIGPAEQAPAEGLDLLTLPPDQYQRYHAIAEIAGSLRGALNRSQLRVLDVGGFAMTPNGQAMVPLAQFLPSDRTTATDLVDCKLPSYVRASGAALPFSAKAFDLVVTSDTLEHVLPPERPAFVDELLRVASHCVIMIGPFFSEQTRQAECALREYLAATGRVHRQLEEHFERGLPSAGDLRALLSQRGLASIEFADGYLPNWLALIMLQLAPQASPALLPHLNRFYNRHFSPCDRREPTYRRGFVIAKQGYEHLLSTISHAIDDRTGAAFRGPRFAVDLADVLDQAERDENARRAVLEAENEQLRQLVRGYERGRFIRFMRNLHRWRERLLREDRLR